MSAYSEMKISDYEAAFAEKGVNVRVRYMRSHGIVRAHHPRNEPIDMDAAQAAVEGFGGTVVANPISSVQHNNKIFFTI